MNAAEHLAADARDVDPHPLGDLLPLIRTRAETPYVPLESRTEQEPA